MSQALFAELRKWGTDDVNVHVGKERTYDNEQA